MKENLKELKGIFVNGFKSGLASLKNWYIKFFEEHTFWAIGLVVVPSYVLLHIIFKMIF